MSHPDLLFPSGIASAIKLRQKGDGIEIWDPIRMKWLVAAPEEWVRQHCIAYLDMQYNADAPIPPALRQAISFVLCPKFQYRHLCFAV